MKREDFEKAKAAIREKDVFSLESVLEKEGFGDRIDPLTLPKAKWHLRHLELKRGNEAYVHKTPFSSVAYDWTDYLCAYKDGFVRYSKNGFVAAYGVIDEIFVGEKIVIDPPQHFFFTERYLSKVDDSELTALLVSKGKNSPKNPESVHATKIFSVRVFAFFQSNMFRRLTKDDFAQSSLQDPTYGIRGLKRYYAETQRFRDL